MSALLEHARWNDAPKWFHWVDIERAERNGNVYGGSFPAWLPWNRPPIPKTRIKKKTIKLKRN